MALKLLWHDAFPRRDLYRQSKTTVLDMKCALRRPLAQLFLHYADCIVHDTGRQRPPGEDTPIELLRAFKLNHVLLTLLLSTAGGFPEMTASS